jgi:peptidoglycan hydrolase-like protein with peptidoglycan-binding domain
MKRLALVATGSLVLALTATQGLAQTGAGSTAQPARSSESDRADVERVQKALKQMGHDPGPIDGVIGSQTSAALRAYQKAHGLSATGRLDAATSAKLAEPGTSSSASPQTGGDTKPNAVDPAQATKTGANVGEGASYSRSTEKGQSTMSGTDQKK